MNFRNRLLTAAALGAALSLTMPAQEASQPSPERHHEKGQRGFSHLQERLKLTPEQVAKVQPVLQEQMTKMRTLRDEAKAGGDRKEVREKMQAIRQQTSDQLKSVLSEEQFAEWTRMQAERGGKHRKG